MSSDTLAPLEGAVRALLSPPPLRYTPAMQFEDQLRRYFGTADLSAVPPAALAAGTERMAVDFGLEKDRSRRFALWVLLYMLGAAPDLDVAFPEEADREAARNFMDAAGAAGA